MSEATADSAGASGEATGADDGRNIPSGAADSTPTPEATGQEQGDQSRINGLMSLAQRRTSERDAALAEIEALKAMLAEASVSTTVDADEGHQPTQVELMYPSSADAEGEASDAMEQPEPRVIHAGIWPARPDYAPQSPAPVQSSPSAQFVREQGEIASLRAMVSKAGERWYDDARAKGLVD